METAAHAGGWSSRRQAESTYASRYRIAHLERARDVMEEVEEEENNAD